MTAALLPTGAPRWTWGIAEQVLDLREEAVRARDLAMVATCEKALAGDRESRIACMQALIRAVEGRT
jgi:hypothetical protein